MPNSQNSAFPPPRLLPPPSAELVTSPWAPPAVTSPDVQSWAPPTDTNPNAQPWAAPAVTAPEAPVITTVNKEPTEAAAQPIADQAQSEETVLITDPAQVAAHIYYDAAQSHRERADKAKRDGDLVAALRYDQLATIAGAAAVRLFMGTSIDTALLTAPQGGTTRAAETQEFTDEDTTYEPVVLSPAEQELGSKIAAKISRKFGIDAADFLYVRTSNPDGSKTLTGVYAGTGLVRGNKTAAADPERSFSGLTAEAGRTVYSISAVDGSKLIDTRAGMTAAVYKELIRAAKHSGKTLPDVELLPGQTAQTFTWLTGEESVEKLALVGTVDPHGRGVIDKRLQTTDGIEARFRPSFVLEPVTQSIAVAPKQVPVEQKPVVKPAPKAAPAQPVAKRPVGRRTLIGKFAGKIADHT